MKNGDLSNEAYETWAFDFDSLWNEIPERKKFTRWMMTQTRGNWAVWVEGVVSLRPGAKQLLKKLAENRNIHYYLVDTKVSVSTAKDLLYKFRIPTQEVIKLESSELRESIQHEDVTRFFTSNFALAPKAGRVGFAFVDWKLIS